MQPKTIKQFNTLNQQFYDKTAEYFNNSRQFYWAGWEKLLPKLTKQFTDQKTLAVLDLGCGNGRFGSFLAENLPHKLKYLGIDNSLNLLAAAKKRFLSLGDKDNFFTQQKDLITAALNNNLTNGVPPKSQDLIVMFGLWHHLPSKNLRQNILAQLEKLLKPNGLLIFTAWKFYEYERFKEKIISPKKANLKKINLTTDDLEENDFILDWQRGTTAYRYCHYSTNKELKKTIKATEKLKLTTNFRADGPQNKSNQYLILEKT